MNNPWLTRRVLHYAHQGGAREAPSSTRFALEQAAERGAEAFELDVHATADGVLVVCHDTTVDRTTPAAGRIAELSIDELGRLDNAHWWLPGEQAVHDREPHEYPLRGRAPVDRAFGVLTLREVLQGFPDVLLNLDIKETAPTVPGYESALATMLREFGRIDDVIVASFHDVATDRFSELAPSVHTSLGTDASLAFYQYVNSGGQPPSLRPAQVALQMPSRLDAVIVVDARFVDAAHEAGLAVHAWTIDDAEEMHRLVDAGVDGIMTDVPSVLESVLRQRSVAFR